MMKRRRRLAAIIVIAVIVLAGFAGARSLGVGVELVPPHRVIPAHATLSPGLETRTQGAGQRVESVDHAIDAALDITAGSLRFGIGHASRWHFTDTERQGHCAEYAQLFAAVFQRIATQSGLRARAVVIRSDARMFGQRLEHRAWRDHDWVLVTRLDDGRQWFVDPSFADTGLGWNVKNNVQGPVPAMR